MTAYLLLVLQLEKKLDDNKAGSEVPASNDGASAAGLSRREEKAPARDSANQSVVSQSTTTGKQTLPGNIVLGEPKTEGMGEATSDVNVHPTSGGETVTQAPASEQAQGTGEATSATAVDSSAEPSTDGLVQPAPVSETDDIETREKNSKFTETFEK